MSEEMKALREQLLRNDKNGYDTLDEAQLREMEAYCADYKAFLNAGKTERLSARAAIAAAEAKGFVQYKRGMALKAGDKVYTCNRGKGLMLAVIGKESMAEGAQIAAAHIDSPRLDLKPTPLYEDSEMAYFKTHYYGGIRKYQWVTVPLELHGKIVRADGSEVYVKIGADPEDPQFVINDLLPHLGREQNQKKLPDAITAENLNVVLGSLPIADADAENRIKLSILGLLNEMYGPLRRNEYKIEYSVRSFNLEEAKKQIKTRPDLLSVEEIYTVAESYGKGTADYEEALRIAAATYPKNAAAVVNAACLKMEGRDVQGAIAMLEASEVKEDGRVLNALGVAYAKQKQYDRAKAVLEQAVQAGSREARTNLEQVAGVVADL